MSHWSFHLYHDNHLKLKSIKDAIQLYSTVFFCCYLEFKVSQVKTRVFWCDELNQVESRQKISPFTWLAWIKNLSSSYAYDKKNALSLRFGSRVLWPSVFCSKPWKLDTAGKLSVLNVSRDGKSSVMIWYCFVSLHRLY